MEFTRIIIRPIHTEKVYVLNNLTNKKFAFEVDVKATKQDIALAFESIYNIKPTKIATQIRKPAKVRTGTAHPGYTKLMKLAYITLPAGTTIAANAEETKTENKVAKKETVVHKDVTKKEITKTTEAKAETPKPTAVKKEVAKSHLTQKEVSELAPSQKVVKVSEKEIQLATGEKISKAAAAKAIALGEKTLYVETSGNKLTPAETADGKKYVRAMPDKTDKNNLNQLPKIDEKGGK